MSLIEYLTIPTETNKERNYFDLCTQIDNILHSYDDEIDAFAELVQNSMDEIIERSLEDSTFEPKLHVHVNCFANKLVVLDNACGIPPEFLRDALRPNCSLKRNLRRKNARGEKGAALVFLQFGHNNFVLESKHASGQRRFELRSGRQWFVDTLKTLDEDGDFSSKSFPADTFDERDTINSPLLSQHTSGCQVELLFGEGCKLRDLSSLFGSTIKEALNRLEHLLRTRTAVGFVVPGEGKGSLPIPLQKLKVSIKVTLGDGVTEQSREVEPGFHFPHVLARASGSPCSLMTNPHQNSELLYDFITPEYIQRYVPSMLENVMYKRIVERYSLNGYISYAYQNTYYEKLSNELLGLESDPGDYPRSTLQQLNGGFQLAVKDYPTGRRHSFLHRSGAEDKSRTYLVLNFRGDYKPDYGRKNIADEVRPFVLELCKKLISFATSRERKQNLKTGAASAPHGAATLRIAKEVRDNEATTQRSAGVWLDSTDLSKCFVRSSKWENEVASEFVHLIAMGRLPGFRLYGLPAGLQLDGMFDYILAKAPELIFSEVENPLGLYFLDSSTELRYTEQWLEFKVSSDLLVDDFRKPDGDPSKKYFSLVDLLVCDTVDDATDGYSLELISTEVLARERMYFGVTHLLKSASNDSHLIQVISLEALRQRWNQVGS